MTSRIIALVMSAAIGGVVQNPAYSPESDTVVWDKQPQYAVTEPGIAEPPTVELTLKPFEPLSLTIEPIKEPIGESPEPGTPLATKEGADPTPPPQLNPRPRAVTSIISEPVGIMPQVAVTPKPTGPVVIYFASNSAGLTATEMEKLLALPAGKKWQVAGYTSPEGSRRLNQKLSKKRAFAVQEYLAGRGHEVPVIAEADGGYVEDADPEKGKAKSRRVVIEEVQ